MPQRPLTAARPARAARGYQRLFVPVADNPESERAVEVAARLAAERHSSITAVTVIEVPPLLPLDAHMREEEEDARRVLDRAGALADAYGVELVPRRIRSRDAGSVLVDQVEQGGFDLVVIGAPRKARTSKRFPAFGRTVLHVLRGSTCRVLVIAPPGV